MSDYLPDHLLKMVFLSLSLDSRDPVHLCCLALVCKQWMRLAFHEDFWHRLNFENRPISEQQFEDMCQRYSGATSVNVYGTTSVNACGILSINLLGDLEALTLGNGQLNQNFFQGLSGCHKLRTLTIKDASIDTDEIAIHHDKLLELHIVNCQVLAVSIRCLELGTLSLKRSTMTTADLECPVLRLLDISSCHNLSDDVIALLVTSLELLESLDLSNCPQCSNGTLEEISMLSEHLRILDASYCTAISLQSVRLSALTSLKLHGCESITSASIDALTHSNMLEALELVDCSFLDSVTLNHPSIRSITIERCGSLASISLRCTELSSITVRNCSSLLRIDILSEAVKEVDFTGCQSLTYSICSHVGGYLIPAPFFFSRLKSLATATFLSTSLVSLSLSGCRAITAIDLGCPYLESITLDGCDSIEAARFVLDRLKSLELGICPKLSILSIESANMTSLELKGCGELSEATIKCPLLKSLDTSACPKLVKLERSRG